MISTEGAVDPRHTRFRRHEHTHTQHLRRTTAAVLICFFLVGTSLGVTPSAGADPLESASPDDSTMSSQLESSQMEEGGEELDENVPDVPEDEELPPAEALPDQPAPEYGEPNYRPSCSDSAGLRSDILSSTAGFTRKEGVVGINPTRTAETIHVSASKAATSVWSSSVGVSAGAGRAMLGELNVSKGTARERSYGVNFGVTKRVPARHRVIVDFGFSRIKATGYTWLLRTNCDKTDRKHTTVTAPKRAAYKTKLKAMP